MLFIHRTDLADVLSVFHGQDADAVCHVMRSDFLMCWETLKPRGGRDTSSDTLAKISDSALAAKQAREVLAPVIEPRMRCTATGHRADL